MAVAIVMVEVEVTVEKPRARFNKWNLRLESTLRSLPFVVNVSFAVKKTEHPGLSGGRSKSTTFAELRSSVLWPLRTCKNHGEDGEGDQNTDLPFPSALTE